MTDHARLIVLAPPELESGFLLAGVEVQPVENAAEAESRVRAHLSQSTEGVLAVYAPYIEAMTPEHRARLERSITPVVVPLPTGLGAEGGVDHRARLMARLQRAIGFRVTFGEDSNG